MRFRKGTRVEVLNLKETLYGAWRSAEIISGNGHTYSVRYYSFGFSNNESLEERVSRKFIRPCPPPIIDVVDRWQHGELVEVLDNFSWKTATVLKELPGRYYVVRLLGGAAVAELTVHEANLRTRYSWQDDQWVMVGKVSCSVKSSTLTGSDVHQDLKPLLKSKVPEETSVASLRLSKRPLPCDWFESAESCTGSPKKIRSMKEDRDWNRFATSSVQKVRVRSKRFSESDDDTDACSVGSCSPIRYDESEMSTSFLDGLGEDNATSCNSDAESSKEAFDCRPELYTYRKTLGKLFASGPLNWDQEASLTDLRLSLKISNDEHLMELRNLKSGVGYTFLALWSYILFSFQDDNDFVYRHQKGKYVIFE